VVLLQPALAPPSQLRCCNESWARTDATSQILQVEPSRNQNRGAASDTVTDRRISEWRFAVSLTNARYGVQLTCRYDGDSYGDNLCASAIPPVPSRVYVLEVQFLDSTEVVQSTNTLRGVAGAGLANRRHIHKWQYLTVRSAPFRRKHGRADHIAGLSTYGAMVPPAHPCQRLGPRAAYTGNTGTLSFQFDSACLRRGSARQVASRWCHQPGAGDHKSISASAVLQRPTGELP